MPCHVTDVFNIARVATIQANMVGEPLETPVVAVPACISSACNVSGACCFELRVRCRGHLVAFKVHTVIAVVANVFFVCHNLCWRLSGGGG